MSATKTMQHPFNTKRASRFWSRAGGSVFSAQTLPAWESSCPPLEHSSKEDAASPSPLQISPLALLESALFLAKEPTPSRRLIQLAGLPEGTRIKPLIVSLNERYFRDQSAFFVAEVAEGFQLRTRPEFAAWLARMQEVPAAVRLSPPVMETLTVIAYRQPVLRAEVERIRGVQCGELIRQLLDQELVKIAGRSEDLGRPFLYGTTKKFLQVFGLADLNDLPPLK